MPKAIATLFNLEPPCDDALAELVRRLDAVDPRTFADLRDAIDSFIASRDFGEQARASSTTALAYALLVTMRAHRIETITTIDRPPAIVDGTPGPARLAARFGPINRPRRWKRESGGGSHV